MATNKFGLALVTGASSGIGLELCRLLAANGINLLITGRDEQRLMSLASELQSKVNVKLFSADLAIPDQRKIVIENIHAHAPDLVVNNAGFGLYGDALTYTTAEQMKILEVNGNALLELSLEAARTLITKKRQGTILNVASVAGYYVMPELSVYAATKSFVVQFSRALDFELQPQGIRMLASCPGMVETEFAKRASASFYHDAESLSMTSKFAALEIWKQIKQGKQIHIFDWKTRWGTYLSKILPVKFMAGLLRSRIASRIPSRPFIPIDE